MGRLTNEDINKVKHVIGKYYSGHRDRKILSEVFSHSKFIFKDHHNKSVIENAYNIDIYVDHEVFIKYSDFMKTIKDEMKKDFMKFSSLMIGRLSMYADIENLEIVDSKIEPVFTEWEDINRSQSNLITLLQMNDERFDLQNIGNSCRLTLQKLANHVFDPNIHIPSDTSIQVDEGKYKNRLHSFITHELSGSENKYLRNFTKSAIDTVEKSVDLANNLTHDLNPERTIAEVCVIGTISAISIIKLVNESK